MKLTTAALGGLAAIAGVAAHDLTQRRHSLLRTFPVIGHGRFLVEAIGPELRQYVVAANDEERPFSRDQRRWVYATAKNENTKFGFGTDNDIDTPGYLLMRQSPFPLTLYGDQVAVVSVGGWRFAGRTGAALRLGRRLVRSR